MSAHRGGRDRPFVRFFNTYEPVTDFYRDLVPELAAAGLASEIVVSSADYRTGRRSLAEALAPFGIRVTRIPAGWSRADTGLRKLLVVLSYTLGGMATSLLGYRAAVNFFLTQPPLFAAWGRVVRAVRGTPYCCLVMDLYPQVLAAHGTLSEHGWLYRLARRLMLATLQSADRVFVIGRCMRERLIAEGVPAERITVVTNWANELRIRPIPRSANSLAARYGLGAEFVVLYSGNLGRSHEFRTLVEAATRLASRTDIRFVFFADGPRLAALTAEKHRRRLDNLVLEGLQPAERLAESQSLGDAHFVTLRAPFTGLVVPSKAYSALAAGRPLIYEGRPEGEIARMLAEHDIGGSVAPGDADALVALIERLADDPARTRAMGQRARALAEGPCSCRASVGRYVDALRAIVAAH